MVFAEAPADSPVDRPSHIRGWVHYHDEDGGAWGVRLHVDHEESGQALGWIEFFAKGAPVLKPHQHFDLFAGKTRVLSIDVIGPAES